MGGKGAAGRLPVIDFHSHILPAVDDGSPGVTASLAMLRASAAMGVDVMAATPHFRAGRESRERFLERRAAAWQALDAAMAAEDGLPRVVLGAEVAFTAGLAEEPALDGLCIQGTRALLLELPFAPWTGYELDAVSALCLDRGRQVILAHFERFLGIPGNAALLERMLELPVLLQLNAGRLLRLGGGKWTGWLWGGRTLLGSDCHDPRRRPPDLGPARAKLRRRAGDEILETIDALGASLLEAER